MAMCLDYKPTRYEGKCFLTCKGNLNNRIHRDITGDRCGLGWGRVVIASDLSGVGVQGFSLLISEL